MAQLFVARYLEVNDADNAECTFIVVEQKTVMITLSAVIALVGASITAMWLYVVIAHSTTERQITVQTT